MKFEPTFQIICDKCGKSINLDMEVRGGGYVLSDAEIKNQLTAWGWLCEDSETHFCEKCKIKIK